MESGRGSDNYPSETCPIASSRKGGAFLWPEARALSRNRLAQVRHILAVGMGGGLALSEGGMPLPEKSPLE